MKNLNIKKFYRYIISFSRSISIRLKLFITMTLAVCILGSNLILFSRYHNQINHLNEQSQEVRKIIPELTKILYTEKQFQKSISKSDSDKMIDDMGNLKKTIGSLEESFSNNPLILKQLTGIDKNVEKFSESIYMFIETRNQEKIYDEATQNTLKILLGLIDSAKGNISSKMFSLEQKSNNTKVAITSYEYLTKMTEILISNDSNNEQKLSELLDISKKLEAEMIVLNMRDKGIQISTYSQELYSKGKLLQSARDFEDNTDVNLSQITNVINTNTEIVVNIISESLKTKEITASTSIIILFICSTTFFFLLAYTSTKEITKKLKILISATKQIAEGDFSVKFIPKDGDELDLLGRHIYHMSENLKGYEKSLLETNINLERANAHLEEAVLERTRQLEKTRDELIVVNRKLENDKKRFELLATTDSLTGIKNRGAIMSVISNKIESYHKNQSSFCIALFDIDDFKKVNDQHGHTVGDEVLIEITKLVKNSLRSEDKIGRYGGEEFVILFPGMSLEMAKIIMQNIMVNLRNTALSSKMLPIRISAGLTEYQWDTIDGLLQRTDDLLYKSKKNGKDQFSW